jgi:hypothetical protein
MQTPYSSKYVYGFVSSAISLRHPVVQSITAGVVIPAGDVAAQILEAANDTEKKSIDLLRVLRFAIFGFFVQVRNVPRTISAVLHGNAYAP